MTQRPTGTVTFLFTDIEGSTPLAQQFPAELPALLARHHAILHQAIESHRGHVFQIVGDAFSAAFFTAGDALAAALDAQCALQHEAWQPAPIKVRMGIHTGAAQAGAIEERAGGYAGYATLARAQRVMSIASGGQVLLSDATSELVRSELPTDVTLRDMGEHRLKGFAQPEYLRQLVAPDLTAEFPPLKSLSTVPNNLPLQLTSFVGRGKEITEIAELLSQSRLVTLTGSGGTGKTRLSQEVGAQVLTNFQHGIWLIELAPLSDPAQIIPALAQVFGLREAPFNPLANIVLDYLRGKKILLLLDNCEHLVEACARLADDWLHQCAGLHILASSREALGIAGEVAYRIPSLADAESTQLFVERARAVNANFKLTDANAATIARICRRLDGIPLAIELAAARVKLLSLEQLATRLDDRFRLLVGGSRAALPRQQTLRALIDWSYDLLSADEKHLLQFASVFAGGWTLEALEFVADEPDTLELLNQLINKSLVVTEEREGEMRYFMLETIRQYAREKLFDAKQAPAARDRHFAYFKTFSKTIEELYMTKDSSLSWQERIQDEIGNLRAALEWGLDTHVEEVIELSVNYCLSNASTGVGADGYALNAVAIERFIALPPTDAQATKQRQSLLAKAYWVQGITAIQATGNVPVAIRELQEGIAVAQAAGDRRMLGHCLTGFSLSTMFIKPPGADEAAEEGYRIFRDEVDDLPGLAMSLMNMARIAQNNGAAAAMRMYVAKLKELIQQSPASLMAGMFYFSSAMREKTHANYAAAKAYLEDSLTVFKQIRNKNFLISVQTEFGHIARYTGRMDEASAIYHKALMDWQNYGNRGAVANLFECFALIAVTEEELQRAAILLGAAEALREKAQSPMTDSERVEYDQCVALLRTLFYEAEFGALWAEGRSMTMEQAVQFAVDESQ